MPYPPTNQSAFTTINEGDVCRCRECGMEFVVRPGNSLCAHAVDFGTRWINPAAVIVVRRAETPPSSTALIAQRPELAPKSGKTLAEIAREQHAKKLQQTKELIEREAAALDYRPVLGKDRNGRDVRRGDVVWNERGTAFTVDGFNGVQFYNFGATMFVVPRYAELVTEQPETYANINGPSGQWNTPLRHCAACHSSIPPNVPTFAHEGGGWCQRCHEDDRSMDATIALESFLRALNTPTKLDRLHARRAEFVDIVGRVLAEGAPRATFVYDFGWMTVKKHGAWIRQPVLVAWLRCGTEEETIAFCGHEDADEFEAFVWKTIQIALARVGHEVMK